MKKVVKLSEFLSVSTNFLSKIFDLNDLTGFFILGFCLFTAIFHEKRYYT